jgi:hypothetical protein
MMKRKRISSVPRYKRNRWIYVPLNFVVHGDNVQLYVRHKGETLVLMDGSLHYVLSIVSGIKDTLAKNIPPLLASTERKAALEEVQEILKSQSPP